MSLITGFGVLALTFMLAMYALERRGRIFILAFAFGCLLSSLYGFLAGAWPFGVVEAVWCVVAAQRFRSSTKSAGSRTSPHEFEPDAEGDGDRYPRPPAR